MLAQLIESLTPTELQCLRLRGTPMNAKEIARERGVSPQRVKQTLSNASRKLGVSTSMAAARLLQEYEAGDTISIATPPPLPYDDYPAIMERQVVPITVREDQVPFDTAPRQAKHFRHWLVEFGGATNDLTVAGKLRQILWLAVLIPAAVGLVITIAEGTTTAVLKILARFPELK